jgi:cell wall-associated NlpC family hydrolase
MLALVPAGAVASSARGAGKPAQSWAAAEIRSVTAAGLMGAAQDPASFRPDDPLTAQELEDLVFGLKQTVFPPDPTPLPLPVNPVIPNPTAPPTSTTPGTTTTTTTTIPTTTTAPTTTVPTTTTPTTTTAPVTTVPTTTTTTTTPSVPPAPPVVPSAPKQAPVPDAPVTMTQLDARLVQALGLSKAASEFARGARAAGLKVPSRFGNEVVARLLGLRTNHPAPEDSLELLPGDHATRAEAAYSAAQVLRFTGWEVAAVQSMADQFTLPAFSNWQTQILDTAVARIGMPYVWGGTSDGTETDFGVTARGGYDCSGFVWRVYKLQQYPNSGSLPLVLRGRTTFQMSGEVPASQRIAFADLQPADVLFFGSKGPRSQPSQVDHTAIYIGNGWFIQSSGEGVALASLDDGWYRREFAWARRPLAEAGLTG